MSSELVQQVEAFLREGPAGTDGAPVQAEDALVVGVSGGPDSLALLHALATGGGRGDPLHPPDRLVVGHVNHGLRPEAAADAQYVARVCAAWGVACFVEEVDVGGRAREEALSLEEAGRLVRYRFLAELARRVGAPAVAVGHNADDQAETVLMHFVRGAGLAGLRGMLPAGRLPEAPDLTLLRPLLGVERAEIERYCAEHDLQPRIDASNVDATFFRNRLRHELLPLLENYNPQIRERLRHTAAVVAADYELLQQLRREAWEEVLRERGATWLRVDLAGWRALPLSLRRSTIRHAVWTLRASLRDVTYEPVEQARRVAEGGEVGAQATLPGGLTLTVEYDAWRLAAEGAPAPVRGPQLPREKGLALSLPGRVSLAGGWFLEAEAVGDVSPEEAAQNADRWTAYVDAGEARELTVRPRRAGERLQPLGMGGHSAKVSDVMINEKVPAALRERWPLVARGEQVVWLVGYRLDRRARVTAGSGRVWRLRCVREGGAAG